MAEQVTNSFVVIVVFFDCLDSYDEVMADRVFQITEELLLKYFALNVLPGARIKSQMVNSELMKPKKLLN